MSDTTLHCPLGSFHLSTQPGKQPPNLRAWSAADEHLLSCFSEHILPDWTPSKRLLIINDQYGALTIPLHSFKPTLWLDSFQAKQNITRNLKANQIPVESIHWLSSTEPLAQHYDCVLLQLPKTYSLLEYQLDQLTPQLTSDARLVAGYMVKHFNPSAQKLFARRFAETHGSQTFKKSRLILCSSPKPVSTDKRSPLEVSQYPLEGTPFNLTNYANVFSKDKLDIGTRALLPFIDRNDSLEHIIDLGCGNGALGITAAYLNPQAGMTFTDESYLATACAQHNWNRSQLPNNAQFITTDCLQGVRQTANLILCNPPFHQNNQITQHTARNMFRQAKARLEAGGSLLVVGNRHLNYAMSLRKIFSQVKQLDANRKFVILQARK